MPRRGHYKRRCEGIRRSDKKGYHSCRIGYWRSRPQNAYTNRKIIHHKRVLRHLTQKNEKTQKNSKISKKKPKN